MVQGIDALVLFTDRLEELVKFYRALGIPLEEEHHDSGPTHYAAEVGGAHFAIFSTDLEGGAPSRRGPGSSQVGFQVSSLEDCLKWLLEQGAQVLSEPQEVPWGRRALVLDPDGRCVELNQAVGSASPSA